MLYKTIDNVRYQQLEKWAFPQNIWFEIYNIEDWLFNEPQPEPEIGMTPEQWSQFEQQCPILTEKTL